MSMHNDNLMMIMSHEQWAVAVTVTFEFKFKSQSTQAYAGP